MDSLTISEAESLMNVLRRVAGEVEKSDGDDEGTIIVDTYTMGKHGHIVHLAYHMKDGEVFRVEWAD